MEEMVASAVVQEAVSGAVSFVFSSRGEKASQEELMERLEMAQIRLNLALEMTRMMPVTIMALFCLKKKLKDVSKECGDLLSKARGRQQMVPSLRRKLMHAVLPSFIASNEDILSSSAVARFERFVEEAHKFVRDVEHGCSPSRYSFLNPLTRPIFEGRDLFCRNVQGNQTYGFCIRTTYVEEYGRLAVLCLLYEDHKVPLKSFKLMLALRLYESTNIVGVASKCLQSLGPQFRSFAEVGRGVLTQVPTQNVLYSDLADPVCRDEIVRLNTQRSPDPFCCIADGVKKPCANNIISSELTGRFPQEVALVFFNCRLSASGCSPWNSTEPLEMSVIFQPHVLRKPEDRIEIKEIFDSICLIAHLSHCLQIGTSLHNIEEGIQTEAVDYFIRHPELTRYDLFWDSAHGCASFHVLKPITTTRRASKRRR